MSKVGEYYRELEEMGVDERNIRRHNKKRKRERVTFFLSLTYAQTDFLK